MSETNEHKSSPSFLTMLVILLIAIVAVQTWYLVEMKQTLNTIQNDQSSIQPEEQLAAETGATSDTENITAPVQSEPVVQQAPADDQTTSDKTANDQTSNKPASLMPPSSPPVLADDDLNNAPPYMQPWNPDEEIQRMQRQMDRIFNHRYNNPRYNRPDNRQDFHYSFRQNISVPEMDMREDQNRYIVQLNIPGAEQKDISINLEGQRLTVTGTQEYKKQNRDASGQIIFSERRSGRFQRSITLAQPVDKKGMQTRIDNGVLQIMIPKRQ
ncbi:MAG: Hsp20 family protein [Gammaproteobacteria bacterium]|nr:Hsp20 family protein [Gammaproteobacteria bacterium]